MQTGLDTL